MWSWNSVDSLQAFVTSWRWVPVVLILLSAIVATIAARAKIKLKHLKNQKDELVQEVPVSEESSKASWWESIDSLDKFETRMIYVTIGLTCLSFIVATINTQATNKLDILKSQRQALLTEAARKESESLRKILAENTQTQSEIGRLENLITQIRLLRKRSDFAKLVEIKNTATNEHVLQWVNERLRSIASDYEEFEKGNFDGSSCKTALECVYGDKLPEMKKRPDFIQLIINDLRINQDLNEVTGIFLALREATGHPFSNFDFDAVEHWCVAHQAMCKKPRK